MKTIEKAAIDYAQKVYPQINGEHEVDIDGAIISNSANSFIAGIEFAQQWISVDDELPEETIDFPFEKYLVLVDIYAKNYSARTVTCAIYECKKWSIDRDTEDIIEFTVTHWRPIELK